VDASRFDRLACALARQERRRTLLQGLAGVATAGILGTFFKQADARRKPNRGVLNTRVGAEKKKGKSKKKCKKGTTRCGKACVSIATDKANCGGCGKRCAATEGCLAGTCIPCDVCPTCTYRTVQAAIDDAQGPADIRLCPGRFTEAVTISRHLTLRGASDGPGGTVLDAARRGSTVSVAAGVTANLVGLRITGGNGTGFVGDRLGGGVYNQGDLTVTGCTITGNGGVVNGGGLYTTDGGKATLRNTTISGNVSNFDGGGIGSRGELHLENCRILDNEAHGIYIDQSLTAIDTLIEGHTVSAWGAGISSRGALNLTRVTIRDNHSTNGDGGGIAFDGTAVIVDSTIAENTANDGGGIRGTAREASSLTGCTVSENHAKGVGTFATGGGGLFIGGPAAITLTGCEIADNDSGYEGGGIWAGGTVALHDCTVSGNHAEHSGGGIFNREDAVLFLKETEVTGNTAIVAGGGLLNHGDLTLEDSAFINNTPDDCIGC
jgi:hypothetical protein